MHVLIINNGTRRLIDLQTSLTKHSLQTLSWQNFNPDKIPPANLIILSGSSIHSIHGSAAKYHAEIYLIKKSTTPILGICFGCELIAHAYSIPLTKLTDKFSGEKIIHLTCPLPGLPSNNLTVTSRHRWIISTVHSPITQLAYSDSGIEIIKHKYKSIWGTQFHPELSPQIDFDKFIKYITAKIS